MPASGEKHAREWQAPEASRGQEWSEDARQAGMGNQIGLDSEKLLGHLF
jgi:hypothetical protein